MRQRVAVIGGGIAGLAAAVRVRDQAPPDTDIIVYEHSRVLGGKLRTGELTGATVERGAESFLVGAPDGTESAAVRRLGLGDALVHPSTARAALASGGRLEPIPSGTLMGIPREYAGGDRDTVYLPNIASALVGDVLGSRQRSWFAVPRVLRVHRR